MKILNVIEKYNYGIIGTIAIHMVLFIWFNIGNMSFTIIDPPEKTIAVLDYTENISEEDFRQKEIEKENENTILDNIKNVTSNQELDETKYSNQSPIDKQRAEQEAIENIKNYEAEEKRKASEDNPTLNTNNAKENSLDPNLYKENEKNEPASFGANIIATASFYVPSRNALEKKIPSYKCKNEGTVRVLIKVSRDGKVGNIEIDETHTNTTNSCLRQQALSYAAKWRFSQNWEDEIKKQGWIEFNYLAQ